MRPLSTCLGIRRDRSRDLAEAEARQAGQDQAALVTRLLLATPPTDRALTGWCPFSAPQELE
jgi:hypothetical protein